MSTGTLLAAVLPVLVNEALVCSLPAITRPTLQFGVRVPSERAGHLSSGASGAPTTGGLRPSAPAAPLSR